MAIVLRWPLKDGHCNDDRNFARKIVCVHLSMFLLSLVFLFIIKLRFPENKSIKMLSLFIFLIQLFNNKKEHQGEKKHFSCKVSELSSDAAPIISDIAVLSLQSEQ